MPFDLQTFVQRAAALVGPDRVLTGPDRTDSYERDWRDRYHQKAAAVVLPGTVEEVAAIVRLCGDAGVAVVPQGGNTGLTGGAVAPADRPAILLNVSRLNRIRNVDLRDNAMTVDAGCILADVRARAEEHGRLFPLLLGSVGSCEVGGLVSTNAGGTGVLRYGCMRELVMGLEAVLPDGSIWNGLRSLRKDNTGYDMKQLFIGAEGTLGIVTAAVLKLFPALTASASAMVAADSVRQAVDLLRFLQDQVGDRIEAFEVLSRSQLQMVMQHGHGLQAPMPLDAPWYVLIEIADSARDWDAVAQMEAALGAAMEADLVADAVVATDQAKARRLWELRHSVSEANKRAGFSISNDTSVPISRLPEFIERVERRMAAEVPQATVCHAGHIGDGNVHVIAILPRDGCSTAEARERAATVVTGIVHAESVALDGSISAEHGIGRMHVARLEEVKPARELDMMRSVKQAFDPLGIMNPGKVFQMPPQA
ncbi:FAD-binding oxidoreductase [Xylophilus sp.]|uniref:FAD-binding oxidoreductase n=1 Tax=Xylophilus sp. TaxID=2653893 RepID=UPI0013B97D39|nr:FAD-binding oxidoreductase [Xylophilus sp.]KAF1048567.1 MAG: putative FAD-linked oxidoreductase [Xylophilus sp.]